MLNKYFSIIKIITLIIALTKIVPANEYINVVDAGVNPYDQYDDALKIDSIINTVGLRTLFFPEGTYYLSHPIHLDAGTSILGENLRGTKFVATANFIGNALIQNFANNGDPASNDNLSYYNTIENIYLINNTQNESLVMMWLIHLWEGSYIRNVHFENNGRIRGGLWHTMNSSVQGGGGQAIFENLNLFYGSNGVCLEEAVKLENTGGMTCRNWNILPQPPSSPSHPFLSFFQGALVLDISGIHVEKIPGNNVPAIKLSGVPTARLILHECDIDAYEVNGTKVGIEINLANTSTHGVEWDLENVSLRSSSNKWNTDFDVPIRIRRPDSTEDITGQIRHIRKFNNMTRLFDSESRSQSNQFIGIGQSILHQQSIGNLDNGASIKINTPDMNNGLIIKGGLNQQKFINNDAGDVYNSRAYLVLITGYKSNTGEPRGGAFLVMKGCDVLYSKLTLNASSGIDLIVVGSDLKLKNTTGWILTKISAMIIGFGTDL